MNWYKIAQENLDQLDLFEDERHEEREFQGSGIDLIDTFSMNSAHFAVFRIKNRNYAYRLSFPAWLKTIESMARRSGGRALNWAKLKASTAYEVADDFPAVGSIIREIN